MQPRREIIQGTDVPLTPMQLGLISESFLAHKPWVNVEQIVVQFGEAGVTSQKLAAGLAALAERHDALRLTVRRDGSGSLTQDLKTPDPIPFDVTENEGGPQAARAEQLESFLERDRLLGFAFSGEPLWRAALLRWDTGHAALVLTIHHAVADGRSMARLARELIAYVYEGALPSASPASLQFSEFCRAMAEALPNADAAEAYFKSYLGEIEDTGALTLPETGDLEPVGGRKRQMTARLSAEQSSKLRAASDRLGGTLANLMQAAWGILLSRWQDSEAVTFGVVRSGRHALPNCEDAVGCLINTLPTCVKLGRDVTLAGVVHGLRQHMLSLHALEQTPAELIRRSIGLHGAAPLFETAVMFENGEIGDLVTGGDMPAGVEGIDLREEAGMPLMLSVYAQREIKLALEYDPALIADAMAGQAFGHLMGLLAEISRADATTAVAELDMMAPDERAMLLGWSEPDTPLPAHGSCLVRLFDDVVRAAPDATALTMIGREEELSFAELDRRSDLAAGVLAALGAGPGEVVAIHLERSIGFVVAVLAALKTGAAFMPVDPALPEAVRTHMLSDSGALIIVDGDGVLKGDERRPIPKDHGRDTTAMPRPDVDPAALAYVIYTSGSTGTPKGVRVSRGNLLAHLAALTAAFEMTPTDRVLQFAGLSFDVAIEEVFTTLMSGATLVLRTDEMSASATEFLDQIEAQKLSVMNLPTAFWTVLTGYLKQSGRRLPPSARLVIVGGEAISSRVLSDWLQVAPEPRWLNGYGPTEATITSALFEPTDHRPGDDVYIGRPTGHALAYVLAPDGSLAPKGAMGELAIGGPAVTQGYIGRRYETTKAFRADTIRGRGRIYCTGDRVQWREGGNLQFHGRQDRQIKLRGHRIELGHIERAVERCIPAAEILCDVLDKNTPAAQLVVWIATPEEHDLKALAKQVAALLPGYMRPKLVAVHEFARTQNGKIDRRALPRPSLEVVETAGAVDAASDLERQICNAMAQVLNLPQVEPEQGFFDLGGHSLQSIEFIGRVEIDTGKKLGIVDFRNNPSPRELARLFQSGGQSSKNIIPIQPEGDKPPLLAIHILGANEEYFRPLAKHLGQDQPVLGVSVGSLDEDTPTGVASIASKYCEEINRHYPDGPVHLMAASLGSYIAYELAQQLQASGRYVGMVAFFDAAGPGGRTRVSGLGKLRALMRRARYVGWGYPLMVGRNLVYESRNKIAQRQVTRKAAGAETQAPKTVFEFIATNELAVNEYTPEPIDIPLIIFRSKVNFFDTRETLADGLGWASVAKGGLRVIDVPGGHLSMLQEPHVETLAREMQAVLAPR